MSTIIGVCSSARQDNVSGLLSRLNRIPNVEAQFVKLPYNDVDKFRLPKGRLHGIILCHSIHNRRFAITDVTDALYNKFLPHAEHTIGKRNVAVIGHDFSWTLSKEDVQSGISHSQKKRSQMTTFRNQQPTTFACSSLAMVCGKLGANWEMDPEDWESLVSFVTNVTPLKQTSFLQPWYLFAAAVFFCISLVGGLTRSCSSTMHLMLRVIFICVTSLPPVAILPWVRWILHEYRGDRARAIAMLSTKAEGSPSPWYIVPLWKAPYSFYRYYLQRWWWGYGRGQND